MITRGFRGKRQSSERIPPGQYVTNDFPVLSAGPTPHSPLATWSFSLEDATRPELHRWTWKELLALPATEIRVDIHCVTKWSKLDTRWKGVTFDALLAAAGREPPGAHVMAFCDGGYTTNVPVADLRGDKGLVAYEYDGEPLPPEHGGRRASSCRTSTSGSRPSGCAGCASWTPTGPASGRRTATTSTATPGKSSGTTVTERAPRIPWRTAEVLEVVAETPR